MPTTFRRYEPNQLLLLPSDMSVLKIVRASYGANS